MLHDKFMCKDLTVKDVFPDRYVSLKWLLSKWRNLTFSEIIIWLTPHQPMEFKFYAKSHSS